MATKVRFYTLDNGDVVSAADVAKKIKIKKTSAYRRLQLSNKIKDVYAKKGSLMSPKKKSKPKPKKLAETEETKTNRKQRYEKMCRETKPFYVDKLYRLMFKVISAVGKK